mgnify:CR=1 FL=1
MIKKTNYERWYFFSIFSKLSYPTNVIVDNQDNIYIADTGNNVIRKINLSDVYNHSFEEIEYIVRDCGTNIYLDKQFNQTLMKDTLCVSCWFSEDKTNSWNYYLNEF